MVKTGNGHQVMQIGVDIGGTFTDFVIYNPTNGELITSKKLSTLENPAQAVLDGLKDLLDELKLKPSKIVITHGSTVATNALLERKGARTALVTTRGFRDVIQIGRQDRPELYTLSVEPRPQLIPRELRFEVDERVNRQGEVLKPLNLDSLPKLIAQIESENVESIAVCLLFSFLTPVHERIIAKEMREIGYSVSVSSEILPEYREYERTSTTVINAYVTPVLDRYLGYLEEALSASSDSYQLRIMQSNGGIIGLDEARRSGVRCILSGPAGGVVAANHLGRFSQIKTNDHVSNSETKLITLDMGGTSTDVSLIDGVPVVTTESMVGGYPIKIPLLNIHTIGAGGGSIARVDEGGALRVGPDSAGADPGPACYARGTSDHDLPTVTDANVVLGRLPIDHFLGGEIQLDNNRAWSVMSGLGKKIGLDAEKSALGVIEVINAHMVHAIRLVSIERGYDPKDFALLSFGGAGGLHACDLARQLGIPKVVIPPMASTFSAFGMLTADVIKDYSQTVMLPGDTPAERILDAFSDIERKGSKEILDEGFVSEDIHLEYSLDMRYLGQSYELNITYGEDFLEDFHRAHEELYGYVRYEHEVEIVNIRLRAIGKIVPPSIAELPLRDSNPEAAYLENREVILVDDTEPVPMFQGELLNNGNEISGPALIARKDTTIFISKDDSVVIDNHGNLIISVSYDD